MATTVGTQKTLLLVKKITKQLPVPTEIADEVGTREAIKGIIIMTKRSLVEVKRKGSKGQANEGSGSKKNP